MTVPSIQCVKTDTDIYISAPASTLILQSFFYLFLPDFGNKVYVFGGPYLSFINYKGNSFRFWWSVPRFPELWEITYVFGGFTLLLFIL